MMNSDADRQTPWDGGMSHRGLVRGLSRRTRMLLYLSMLMGYGVDVAVAAEPLPAIRVSDNGRYFVKSDGAPFFWLGDTAWCIFNHPSPEDVDFYLSDRAGKGFNVIQGCVAVWDWRTRRNPDGQIPLRTMGRL